MAYNCPYLTRRWYPYRWWYHLYAPQGSSHPKVVVSHTHWWQGITQDCPISPEGGITPVGGQRT